MDSRTHSWHVLVPAKPLRSAKTRLALPDGDRAELAAAMLRDTIRAVRGGKSVSATHLITVDAQVGMLARSEHVAAWTVEGAEGLNNELEQAALRIVQTGSRDGIAVVLGDLPCLTARVFSELLAVAPSDRQSFLTDVTGTGTTMLMAPPGIRLTPAFEGASTARHSAVAESIPAASRWRAAQRDVDTLEDLCQAINLGVGPHTDSFLRKGNSRAPDQLSTARDAAGQPEFAGKFGG